MTARLKQAALILATILLASFPAWARIVDGRAYGPLPTRTQNPILLQFLSLPFESPQTLNKRQLVSEIQTTFTNLFERGAIGNTRVSLDMEIWRTVFAQEYGLTDNLDLRFELPFITSSGGFLDASLQDYHNTFGFPNGGRQFVPDNTYAFTLSQGGTTLFNHTRSTFGLSDVSLRAKWMTPKKILGVRIPFKLAVVPSIKLPTGLATKGLSSGRFDFGLGLLGEKSLGRRFHFVSQAGLVILGGHRDIGALVNKAIVQFGQSVEYQIVDGFSFLLQLTGTTPFFKNVDAKALKGPAFDLAIGCAGSFPFRSGFFDEFYYKFAFTEDAASTGPSVDFSTLFLAGLRY